MTNRVWRCIRWQDPLLWPADLAYVPEGYVAVTQRPAARRRIRDALADDPELSNLNRGRYAALWNACLTRGMQPSGMVLVNMNSLTEWFGFGSRLIPNRFGRWCTAHHVWVYVPGKLAPYPQGTAVGRRTRVYLVIQPGGTR